MDATYIIGQACRLPGSPNVAAFRTLLQEGRCAVSEVPQDRFAHSLFMNPKQGVAGKSYTFRAGVLDDIWGFDLSVFKFSPREAVQMDPQQRLLLQVVWEAMEDARLDSSKLAGKRVGVYVGASSMDHGSVLGRDPSLVDSYLMTGNTLSLVANRISHGFDLRGPSFVVDTACSSSLVAMDQARQALSRGDIDTAIVAGVNLLLSPSSFAGFSAARMLSPTGLCQSFSDKADGYVRAEGCVAMVLQNSSDIPVTAKARVVDSETNADGYTMNVALPAEEGQYELLARLYDRQTITPDDLSFVEAHGTGTLVGDPIEAHALGRAVSKHRKSPLPIGSAKSNVGHLEPASGMVGMLKALIAMEDRRLPRSLHAENLNPHIDFDEQKLVLARDSVDLGDGPLFCGVSSFGFGGVNGHVILEGVTPPKATAPAAPTSPDRIFVTSAFSDGALKDLATAYADRMEAPAALNPGALPEQAWHQRGLHPKRLGVLAEDGAQAAEALRAYAAGQKDPRFVAYEGRQRDEAPVFVYSGNGSQYLGMGRLPFRKDADYRAAYEEFDALFTEMMGWSVIDKMNSETLSQEWGDCRVIQGLVIADQIAQTVALAKRGIVPAAVIGHSGGEVAAAWAAGALSLEQAAHLAVSRSRTQLQFAGTGTMAALQTSAEQTRALLDEFGDADIELAAINSPRSVTLAGPTEPLKAFAKWAKRTHRQACVMLDINYPFHSAILQSSEAELKEGLSDIVPSESRVPMFSTTTGALVDGTDLTTDYWWANVRQPVQFKAAVEAARDAGYSAFLEVGAQPVLPNYITDSLDDDARHCAVVHTLAKNDPETANPVARAALRAVLAGIRTEQNATFAATTGPLVSLPRYAFQNEELRATNSQELSKLLGTDGEHHPLLGAPLAGESGVWRRDLDDNLFPALADHKVGDSVLLPGTAFAEMAYAAASVEAKGQTVEIYDMDLFAPIVLSTSTGVEIQTEADANAGTIRIMSRARLSKDAFRENMRARFVMHSKPPVAPALDAPGEIAPNEDISNWVYEDAERIGLYYGPNFKGLKHARRNGDDIDVILREGLTIASDPAIHGFDPAQLDCLLHGLIAISANTDFADARQALLPVRMGRIQVHAPGVELVSGRIHLRRWGDQSIHADVVGFGPAGEVVVEVEGLRLRATQIIPQINFARQAFHVEARPILSEPGVIATDIVETALNTALTPEEADDDALLLLDAAAQQAVWSAFRKVVGKDGLYKMRRPEEGVEGSLIDVLARLDLAWQGATHGEWHIAEDCDLPDADLIGQALLEERPDLIGLIALILRLPAALDDVLTQIANDNPAPEPEVLFGREAVQALDAGPHVARRDRLIAAALDSIVARVPRTESIQIGAMSGFDLLQHSIKGDHPGLERVQIMSADGEEGMVSVQMRAVKWGETAELDVVLVDDPLQLFEDGMDERLKGVLAPTGVVMVVVPAMSAFRRAVMPSKSNLVRRGDVDRLVAQLSELGLETVLQQDLPDGAAGGTLVMAKLASAATEAAHVAPDEVAKSDLDLWTKAITHLHGPVTKRDGVMTVLEPEAAAAPLVLFGATGADEGELADRVLFARDIVAEAVAENRGVLAVLPKGAQYAGGPVSDPVQHAIWAMLRTAANENPGVAIHAIDASGSDISVPASLAALLSRIEAHAPRESEIVLAETGVLGLRVETGLPLADGAVTQLSGDGKLSTRLRKSVTGRLDALSWESFERKDLADDEVEVEIAATGLNYRDVMWSMGLLPEEALETGFAGPTLGLECAGRVSRVGPGVTEFKVGDPVVAFGPSCFASHIVSQSKWLSKLPEGVSFSQAATLPVAYFTAYYAMVTLGNLQPDETVLIHGGAGGVGLAAIAIAKDIGATVIATAGSPVKQQLLRSMGVEHVVSSRESGFAAAVREITGGQGVDVVLNSLAGQAMEQSLALLRPYGRFLELGKQDYYTNTGIGLRPLKNNVAYHGIDVDSLLADRPDIASREFRRVMAGISEGRYAPLPFTEFSGGDVIEAFRFMQRSGHIGKVVVRPNDVATDWEPLFRPRPGGWFVLAGGLGGMGLETAKWLASGDLTHVALLGRRTEMDAETKALVDKIERSVDELRVVSCDITDLDSLNAVLDDLRKVAPIHGVFHTAMVLEDRAMGDIDRAQLDKVLPVKTKGLANLDAATRDDDLQVFVAYTSLANLIGNHGQAAYVAANAYQESLIEARAATGRHARAMGWGAITDVGYLRRDTAKRNMLLQMSGNVKFSADQALRAQEFALTQKVRGNVLTVTPMGWGPSIGTLGNLRRPTFGLLRRMGEAGGSSQSLGTLRADLEALPFDKAVKRATAYLKTEIASILRVPENTLSPTRPLAEYGMDSLMGVELTLAAQKVLGDDLPVPSLGDDLSITKIAGIFVTHIQSGASADGGGNEAASAVKTLATQHMGSTRSEAAE
ncbi:acyl transferase domain-containing protein [Maritimibacter alkaliphilus HTCC2654]|uniref:type I polyketide synthase n=1 Tax=Maritimibacter alkaliphilus TaxID=404236 RepID=UPI000320A77B|nr:type I polyketide synthase [Maritimibacter alkaliphilus]TYP85688.1 acyl transferase domain-containing protein [Maritimibacter alkaliphilus HTCC2654]